MRSRYVVAFTLIMAVCLAWAPGSVAAGHGLVVASQHTDFGTGSEPSPATLENMTVSGTGDSANVLLSGTSTTATTVLTSTANTGSVSTKTGVVISPNADLSGVTVTVDENVADATRMQVYRVSDDALLETKTISGPGTYTFSRSFSSAEDYRIVLDNSGSSYTYAFADESFPITSGNGDIIEATSGDAGSWTPTTTSIYNFESVEFTEGKNDGVYASANHSVSNAESAAINITQLTDADATLTVSYYDGSSWVTGNTTTVSTVGNHTLELPSVSSNTWRVNVSVNITGENPEFALADESILFKSDAPSASNLQPGDGTKLSSSSTTFSVDVADTDFGTAQGDSVTATLYIDGTQEYQETISSNATVSTSETLSTGGDHTYHWELNDSYGESTTTATKTITVPAELRIYNESAPTELVDTASVELRFYFESGGADTIVTRTTSNGTIDMSGLPADEPFVVVAEAENYSSRRIFVPSLYEAQRVYLLPTTAESSDIVFAIEDYTGSYPQDVSVLEVQRAITRDYDGDGTNETEWETVLGDYFGANGQFPAVLETGVRYRLLLRNTESGDTRILGSFTPLGSQTQTVTVSPDGGIEDLELSPTVAFQPDIPQLPALNGTDVSVVVDNRSSTLSSWNVSVVHVNTTSGVNTTLYSASSTDPGGGVREASLDLSGDVGRVVVSVSWTTDAGLTDTVVESYSINAVFNDYRSGSLLHIVSQDLPALIPAANWGAFAAMFAILSTLFFTAGVAYYVDASSELLGLFAVAMLAAWGTLGFINYNIVYATGVAWIGLATLRRGL